MKIKSLFTNGGLPIVHREDFNIKNITGEFLVALNQRGDYSFNYCLYVVFDINFEDYFVNSSLFHDAINKVGFDYLTVYEDKFTIGKLYSNNILKSIEIIDFSNLIKECKELVFSVVFSKCVFELTEHIQKRIIELQNKIDIETKNAYEVYDVWKKIDIALGGLL